MAGVVARAGFLMVVPALRVCAGWEVGPLVLVAGAGAGGAAVVVVGSRGAHLLSYKPPVLTAGGAAGEEEGVVMVVRGLETAHLLA